VSLGKLRPILQGLHGLRTFSLHTFTALRIGLSQQRRTACWRNARWLGLHPDVVQYLPYAGAMRDEGDDAHLPATQGHNKGNTS
jgi:hypothetical protein